MAPADFPAGGYTRDYVLFWVIWAVILFATVVFFRRRRGRAGAVRLVAGNLLVLLSLGWGVVLAAETYLRYVYDATDAYGLTLTNFSWFLRHARPNSSKFRDHEWVQERKPGVQRVACVGDSFTFGYGVPNLDDCWPQRLGTILREESGPRATVTYDVRNYGLIGFDTAQEIEVARHALRDGGADRIILGYCLNDIDDLAPPGRRFMREEAPAVPFIPRTSSFVADFLWFRRLLSGDSRIRGYYEWLNDHYADRAMMAQQTERFRRMKTVVAESGKRLDVVVFPLFGTWGPGYEFDACHEQVAAAWKSVGVDVIDLREAYRGIPGAELVASRFDSHPGTRAHGIAARVVADRLFLRR